jgi:hypothetical protein
MSGPPNEFEVPPALDERLRMMEHYRWVSERLISGWRYGIDRNDVKKTRWQITPWNSLDCPPPSASQQIAAVEKSFDEKQKDDRIVKMLIGLMKSGRLKLA